MTSWTNCSLDILCIYSFWCLNYISFANLQVWFSLHPGIGIFSYIFLLTSSMWTQVKKTFEDILKPDQSALSLQLLNTHHTGSQKLTFRHLFTHTKIFIFGHIVQHYVSDNNMQSQIQRWIKYNIYPCLLGIKDVFPTKYPRKCPVSIGTIFSLKKSIHIKYVWEVLN